MPYEPKQLTEAVSLVLPPVTVAGTLKCTVPQIIAAPVRAIPGKVVGSALDSTLWGALWSWIEWLQLHIRSLKMPKLNIYVYLWLPVQMLILHTRLPYQGHRPWEFRCPSFCLIVANRPRSDCPLAVTCAGSSELPGHQHGIPALATAFMQLGCSGGECCCSSSVSPAPNLA